MSTALAEEIRWVEICDNEWAVVHELFRGDNPISPGRVVDWGNSNGPNVAVVLGDGLAQEHRRVGTHGRVDIAKRHLLAIVEHGEDVLDTTVEHECEEHSQWSETYKITLGQSPIPVVIRKEWGIWSMVKAGEYVTTDLGFCPFCGLQFS